MDEMATRLSWKILPEPVAREWFKLPLTFTKEEGEKLRRGHIPRVMEDRWFVFYENEWLHFCRSWTGAHIYGLNIVDTPNGMQSSECWASRDPEHYHNILMDQDKALLSEIISFVLECDPSDDWW